MSNPTVWEFKSGSVTKYVIGLSDSGLPPYQVDIYGGRAVRVCETWEEAQAVCDSLNESSGARDPRLHTFTCPRCGRLSVTDLAYSVRQSQHLRVEEIGPRQEFIFRPWKQSLFSAPWFYCIKCQGAVPEPVEWEEKL